MPKISALPPAGTLADDDETPFVDNSASTTKKFTFTGLKTYLQSLVGWISTAMLADGAVTPEKVAHLSETFTILPSSLSKGSRSWAVVATLTFTPTITGKLTAIHTCAFGFDTSARTAAFRIKLGTDIISSSGTDIYAPSANYACATTIGYSDTITVNAETPYTVTVEMNCTSCYYQAPGLTVTVSK